MTVIWRVYRKTVIIMNQKMRVAVRRTAAAVVGRGATVLVTKAVAVHMQDLEEGEAEGEE